MRHFGARLLETLGVALAMTVIAFAGLHAIGYPVAVLISPDADQATRAATIAALGLVRPLWTQYGLFLRAALHGDLGRSFVFNEPAPQLIAAWLPAASILAGSGPAA